MQSNRAASWGSLEMSGMLLPRSQLETAWKLTPILSASSVWVIFRDFLNETIFLPTCFILNIIIPSL